MIYDITNKKVNDVELTKTEWQILEILIECKGGYTSAKEIANIMYDKHYISGENSRITDTDNIRLHISVINKKTNGLIKCRRLYGYYFDEDVEII